jgi:CDP-paratose 2-epimerase
MSAVRPALRRVPSRVLVTGGCGFIGCNLSDALASRGGNVLVLDSLARAGAKENADWLKRRHGDRIAIEVADIRDRPALQGAVRQATAVLHLAAQVAVTTSLENPAEDFAINAAATVDLLESVRRHNPKVPILFASTNKVYGKLLDEDGVTHEGQRYVPSGPALQAGVAENAPLDFYSPYGCSKGAADQYVRDYARVLGLRTVVLRMSCIYGPRQFGTEDQGWIAHFLIRAIRGEPITIYGDGLQVRDALFIDDAVAAWLTALERIDEVSGQVFNLGGGVNNAVSLLEMMDLIAALRGERPSIAFAKWRPGDQPWYVSDIRRLSMALGWTPKIALREGLHMLHGWLNERFGQASPPLRLREASA